MKIFLKILSLLARSIKLHTLYILLLIIVGMLLEMVGISLFIPIIMGLLDPEFITKFPEINIFLKQNFNIGNEQLIFFVLTSLVIFFLFKTFFMVFLAIRQASYIYNTRRWISEKIYRTYLWMPYHSHLKKNSSLIIRNITSDIGYFTSGLRALMIMTVDGFLLLGIFLVLMFLEPIITLTISLVIALTVFTLRYFTKDKLLDYGKQRQSYDGQRIKHVQHTVGGIKDIKISSKEHEFNSSFISQNLGGITAERKQFIISQLPKNLLEFSIVFCIGALVITLISIGRDASSITLTLGVMAIAIFRMLPSANRITSAAQQFRYSIPTFESIYEVLISLDNQPQESKNQLTKELKEIQFNRDIELVDLDYKYPESDELILGNINLTIPAFSMIGIIGESGAGKSTLINLILGLLDPTKGKILVDDNDIGDSLKSWQKNIGYVSQQTFLLDDTFRKNIAFSLMNENINNNALDECLKVSQLQNFINSLPDGLDTIVGERGSKLSGGQQQRVGIARALYNDPKVLVLDEATSNLDVETESRFMEAVKSIKGKRTIIMISHRMSILKSCDDVYEISNRSLNLVPKNNILNKIDKEKK